MAAATALFEDGRVRPPQPAAAAAAEERGRWRLLRASEGSSSLARLPVLLTGICSGGAGDQNPKPMVLAKLQLSGFRGVFMRQ